MTNPAHLSTVLATLFPPGAVAAELRATADPALLFPTERERLGRSVPKRVHEFTAGRLCSRRALAELGIENFPIRVADDRQPLWPAGVCGSITHTDGFCAAVVARLQALASLGIDAEIVGRVQADLWRAVFLPVEIAWLHALPAADRAAAASMMFSAKEAFYKCQYAVVREALGFHAVRVEACEWHGSQGNFTICAVDGLRISAYAEFPLCGRYLFHEEVVTAGIALPPGERAAQ